MIITFMKLWCRVMAVVQRGSFALRNNILMPTFYYTYYYTGSFEYTDLRDYIEYFYTNK